MPVTTKLRYLRIAPRKVRLVADLIRKKKIEEAQAILNFTTKKTAGPLLKLLNTALADARHNFQLDPKSLYISKITVDEGPKYKRWQPRSRGMAYEIQKKSSHITLVLEEVVSTKKPSFAPAFVKATAGEKATEGKKVKKVKEKKIKKKAPWIPRAEKEKKEIKKTSEVKKPKIERPKFKPSLETEKPKLKIARGIKRIFRRKAF